MLELMRRHARLILAVGTAVATGVFLAVAARTLSWTDETTVVVGAAMAALLGFLGTPLVLLPLEGLSGDRFVGPLPGDLAIVGNVPRPVNHGVLVAQDDDFARRYALNIDANESTARIRPTAPTEASANRRASLAMVVRQLSEADDNIPESFGSLGRQAALAAHGSR